MHGLPAVGSIVDLSAHTGIPGHYLWRHIFHDHRSYRAFQLPKKAGGYRLIESPNPRLKILQRWILDNILARLMTTASCFGFTVGSTLRSHAEQHASARAILTLDIERFFPSISIPQVTRVFRIAGYSSKGAWILARLCTSRGALPQGAPTSPKLANLVCFRMDRRLAQYATLRGIVYTRYADDLTFSSYSANLLAKARPFIAHIVNDSGFKLNHRKSRLAGARRAKVVTGLVVAPDQVGIGRKRLRQLRARIHHAHAAGDAAELGAIQGWLDYLSDVDLIRYRIIARYITSLIASESSRLTTLRLAA
jgi:RNA-directed DNA polymerase